MAEQEGDGRLKGQSFLIENILSREEKSDRHTGCSTTGEDCSARISETQATCSCSEDNNTSPDCHLKFRHKKKTRTVFSRHQIFYLESAFEMKRYLSSTERSEMARTLKLTETQVKVWFQNRRNKWKSQMNGQDSYSPETQLYPPFSALPVDPRLHHRLPMLHPFYI